MKNLAAAPATRVVEPHRSRRLIRRVWEHPARLPRRPGGARGEHSPVRARAQRRYAPAPRHMIAQHLTHRRPFAVHPRVIGRGPRIDTSSARAGRHEEGWALFRALEAAVARAPPPRHHGAGRGAWPPAGVKDLESSHGRGARDGEAVHGREGILRVPHEHGAVAAAAHKLVAAPCADCRDLPVVRPRVAAEQLPRQRAPQLDDAVPAARHDPTPVRLGMERGDRP
mmetsp:Transcript_31310/g.74415  ORF Transcript_31310/g.74415 Transcript_31310/m.74415 type:complete len:226 (-) Transcript_31310:405-1082(-)